VLRVFLSMICDLNVSELTNAARAFQRKCIFSSPYLFSPIQNTQVNVTIYRSKEGQNQEDEKSVYHYNYESWSPQVNAFVTMTQVQLKRLFLFRLKYDRPLKLPSTFRLSTGFPPF